jgi:hypothetical protein
MNEDLRSRFEQLGDRGPERPDAMERLRATRDRRQRARARRALALGLTVAVVGAFVAFSLVHSRTTRVRVSTPAAAGPGNAVVTCKGRDTQVDVGTAVARPEGAHVEVRNETAHTIAFAASDTGEFDDVAPGTTTLVESFFFSPGRHFVACGRAGRLPGSFDQQILVVDPQGVWIPWDLVCPGSQQWGTSSLPSSVETDPIRVAGEALGSRVHEGDRLQLAGYTESPQRRVVQLIRGGDPIAEVWMRLTDGGWIAVSMNGCPSTSGS